MNTDFIAPLLHWFEEQAADLPWRRSKDPYHIWLAEVMLQQTQVATVIPYYERFIQQYPTVQDLAVAPQDELMKQWEGLGYYSRARNLQAAAQQLMASYGGVLPQTVADLQKLKGVGRYTAGAIASIAFGEASPVLDGNVIRVFARLFDNAEDVRKQTVKNQLWHIAEGLMHAVPDGQAGDYNQALMELGRTICKPRNPACGQCPIAEYCQAYTQGTQHQRPVKTPKPPIPHYDVTCGLIWNQNRDHLLIAKRPTDKLLGGLWEFPGGKVEIGETMEACLARELQEELGITVAVEAFFIRVQHAYTHFRITLHAFECQVIDGEPVCYDCAEWRWVSQADLQAYAFSRADRKIIEYLLNRPNRLF